jgi:DNA-binding GntR family transcriptional regulator
VWFNARDFIEAVLASGEEARPLGIPANAPLVRIEGVPLSASGEVLRYPEGLYRADRFRFAADTALPQEVTVQFRDGDGTVDLPVAGYRS